MEKPTRTMSTGGSKKLQDTLKRAEELRLLASRVSSGADVEILKGIERAAANLMRKAGMGARKVSAISSQVQQRKLHTGDKKTSEFGKLVGKLGQVGKKHTSEKAAKVIDDLAEPMVKQMLKTSKGVLDAMDAAAEHAITGLDRVQRNSIESCQKLKVQTKRILMERATQMITKIETFAKETYKFMTPEEIKEMTKTPIEGLLATVGDAISRVDTPSQSYEPPEKDPYYIPNEVYDEDTVNRMKNQHTTSRDALLVSAIGQAVFMVGEDMAWKVSEDVFGLNDTDHAFELIHQRQRKRGADVVGGLFGMTKATITGTGQIGSAAVESTGDMVKTIAVGEDGKSGLAGENGVANTIFDTAGDVANTMLDTARSIGESIFGSKGDESRTAVDIARDVANSMVDCVADIGSSLIDGIGGAVSGAAGLAGDLAKGLADFASNAWDAASDMASGIYDSLKDMLGLADEEVEDAVDDVAEAADEMMDEAEEDIDDLFDEEEDDLDDLFDEEEYMEDEWDEDFWDEEWEDWEDWEDWEEEEIYEEAEDEEQEEEQEQDEEVPEEAEDEEPPDTPTTTPMGNDSPSQDNGLQPTEDKEIKMGWKEVEAEVVTGLVAMMHDGDQQLFNPYGPQTGAWTMYSFRPYDAEKTWPQIAITPASFEAIRSMKTMLNNVPFVVVKEYFFKNTASTMIDFVKKIAGMVQGAKDSPKDDNPADSSAGEDSSQGAGTAKSTGNTLMDKIKEIFHDIPMKSMVIDIPYILYFCLRQKQYGNTYIFPYIAPTGTVINEASNASEWGENGNGGIGDILKRAISGVAGAVGNFALKAAGSQGQMANLFPAPSWKPPENGEGVSFSFELILINDNVVKARNNYMCANTIIHNNRAIQKAILNFPGALYEVWLPTGQRHLMCTGDFKLSPIGLNRMTPNDFFKGSGKPGANLRIGVDRGDAANIQNPEKLGHRENGEVLPDAYKLAITFKSCLANNMNTAVFQYYVKMTGYDSGSFDESGVSDGPGGKSTDDIMSQIGNSDAVKSLADKVGSVLGGDAAASAMTSSASEGRFPTTAVRGAKSIETMRMGDILDSKDLDSIANKFAEATYNKRLGKLRTDIGDQTVNSDSAVTTIKKSQSTVKEISAFLAKLYNAPDNNLWYREDPKDELYTTLKPDYRKMLRNKYQDKMRELRSIDSRLRSEQRKLSNVESQISTQFDLGKRAELLEDKVRLTRSINTLMKKREETSDEIIQTDTDIIQSAFDERDSVVSVAKMDVGFRIFQQVWNEKIMNQYEKDKLQYLTSQEKERYFKDKLRELEKFDEHGVLRKPDWFFRVVVLDYIVGEMKRLILWFKDCSWDDFELVYKITRKLRMLQLDVDAALSDRQFDINHTNLFQVSDKDIKDYTRIDKMLRGNTLYELFSSIIKVKFVKFAEQPESDDSGETKPEDRELVMDRTSEIDTAKQRTIRQDIVARYWGSEAELTKAAYDIVNTKNNDIDQPVSIAGVTYTKMNQLKDAIITLKLTNPTNPDLKELLGALVNQVAAVKEALVIAKMNEMHTLATSEIEKKDESVKAEVVR